MNAMQRLNRIVKEKGPLIAGLDPDFDKIKQVWITQNEELVADGKLEGDPEKNRTIMGTFCQDYIEAVKESGLLGAFTGGVKAAAGGIAAAVFFGYLASLISKPKMKKQ